MGKKVTITKSLAVDEGIYSAKLHEIKDMTGKHGPYYRLTFKILKGKFKTKTVNGNMSSEIAIGTKPYKWLSALAGEDIDVDETIDLEDYQGNKCKISVEQNKTDVGTFANVSAVFKNKSDDDDDDEEEDEPKKKKKKKKDDDDDDEEEEEEPKKKKKKKIIDDDDDDDDEDEEPKKKKKKKKKDDDDDEDDDDPEFE